MYEVTFHVELSEKLKINVNPLFSNFFKIDTKTVHHVTKSCTKFHLIPLITFCVMVVCFTVGILLHL